MDEILPVLGSTLNPLDSSEVRRNILSQEEFFKIMISELTNQDPLEPLDNREFLSQLTQLQTLDSTTRLAAGIESLRVGQQISAAGVLIGKVVSGLDAAGAAVSGTVDRVIVEDQRAFLGVGTALLPLANVREVLPSENGAG